MGYAKRSLIVLPLIFLIRFFILFFAISHIKPSRLLYPISQGVRGQKRRKIFGKIIITSKTGKKPGTGIVS